MIREEQKLLEKYGKSGAWKVPEGYFESVYKEIHSKLPPYKSAMKAPDMSLWQRVKPYVYLAAMFAGIWLMMKVFHNATGGVELSLENPPAQVAVAMSEPDVADYYLSSETYSDMAMEEEVGESYGDIKDFEVDFDYKFEPQYASMVIK